MSLVSVFSAALQPWQGNLTKGRWKAGKRQRTQLRQVMQVESARVRLGKVLRALEEAHEVSYWREEGLLCSSQQRATWAALLQPH